MAELEITAQTLIGDLIQTHPEAERVIERYFGPGCFTCPGMRMESLGFGALMHGVDVEKILEDLHTLPGIRSTSSVDSR